MIIAINRVFVFRVDSSIDIGYGHLERCLVLANRLKSYGANSIFVCRNFSGFQARKITNNGHNLYLMQQKKLEPLTNILSSEYESYQSWLGGDIEDDVRQTNAILKKNKPLWLIIDHYAIDIKWELKINKDNNLKVLVIDGLGNRSHNVDMLLDPTNCIDLKKKWESLINNECRLYSGAKFSLLRDEFYRVSRRNKQSINLIKVFISLGGVDRDSHCLRAINFIVSRFSEKVNFDIVVGMSNPNLDKLISICKDLKNVNLHIDPKNIAEIMSKASFAITSGGTTLLELFGLGIPALVVIVAKNQENLVENLDKAGFLIYVGNYTKKGDSVFTEISELVNNILHGPKILVNYHKKLFENRDEAYDFSRLLLE